MAGPATATSVAVADVVAGGGGGGAAAAASNDGCLVSMSGCSDVYLPSFGTRCCWCSLGRCECDRWYQGGGG